MKRVYLGNTELTTIATVTNGGGGGDDTQKWVDYFNGTSTEFTVPEGVTKIKAYAFKEYAALTSVTISNNITSIGDNAFEKCSSLTGITIPNSVTSIGNYAFKGCYAITGITIPNSVTSIGNFVFVSCTNLSSVTIGTGVTAIGNYAFQFCSSLTGITIPNSVTSIGRRAFYDCAKLTTMTVEATTPPTLSNEALPSIISAIYVPEESVDTYKSADGWKDFASKIKAMPALKVTYLDGSVKRFDDIGSVENKANAKTVEIFDNNMTMIDEYAFADYSNLVSITLPASIIDIGSLAFYGLKNLTSFTIQAKTPPSVDTYRDSLTDTIYYVPADSVDRYKSAKGWKNYAYWIYPIGTAIPVMKVTYIDGTEKTAINWKITISKTIENKENAKTVEIYDTVTEIGGFTFYNCSNLTSVSIGTGVTSIGERAFYGCSSLTGITIPNSVTSIGGRAFYDCPKLVSVTIKNSSSKLNYANETFKNISSSAKLYVPSNLLADYQADSNWTGAFRGGIYAIQ